MPDPKFEGRTAREWAAGFRCGANPDLMALDCPNCAPAFDRLVAAAARSEEAEQDLKNAHDNISAIQDMYGPAIGNLEDRVAELSNEVATFKTQRDEAVGLLREARDEIKHAQSCYLMDRSITGHRPLSRMDDPNLCDCDYPHELVARIDAQLGKEPQ